MAKKHRRRVIILESESEPEDQEGEDEHDLVGESCAPITCAKNDEKTEKPVQKKFPKPPSKNPGETRKMSASKKRSFGTLPLEFFKQPAAKASKSSGKAKVRASEPSGDAGGFRHAYTHEKPRDHRLWVDKYAPGSVADLVVHSKKVAEVREWFEGQLLDPYGPHSESRVLVLTGPAGVGKTAVVHVLAGIMGVELLEWTTPTPELWQEYSHHAASGGPYISKLDEFVAFLERARMMSSLPVVSVAHSTSQRVTPFSGDDRIISAKTPPKVLFIDDLPLVSNRNHHEYLVRSFHHLALSRSVPTIVVITDESGSGDRTGERDYPVKDVVETLEAGGAKKIGFNPVTVNAIKKLLSKIQILERCKLPPESLSVIAESSLGDIRQALTSLQFLCLGYRSHGLHHSMWDPGGLGSSQSGAGKLQMKDTEMEEIPERKPNASIRVGRDSTLSFFHALGKLLHNKRCTEETVDSGKGTRIELKEELQRHPLNMEEPEAILSQAHTETATVLAFLHENVLQFVDEDAIEDVADISAYFSDTDCMLGARGAFRSRHAFINPIDFDPSQVTSVAASSVAARGVLFGNAHPAPPRWQSFRPPALWQVERRSKQKKDAKPFQIVEAGKSMQLDARIMEDCRSVMAEDVIVSRRPYQALQTHITEMCIEDEIEDLD